MQLFCKTILKLFLTVIVLLFFGCESDPITVDSSFSNNNSFYNKVFELDSNESVTTQDPFHSVGQSYRLYAGNIDRDESNSEFITSNIFFKFDTESLKESKFCKIDQDNFTDSTISSLDSVTMIFRTFTEMLDDDSLLLIDKEALEIRGAFLSIENWNEDSLEIFNSPFDDIDEDEWVSLIDTDISNMKFEKYMLKLNLPIVNSEFEIEGSNIDWCNQEKPFFIFISYSPDENDEVQYIEMTSSQYSAGFSTSFRPSIEMSYNEIQMDTQFIDKFLISDVELYSTDSGEMQENEIYFVDNDTLFTHSNILIFKNGSEYFESADSDVIQDSINAHETHLYDVHLDESTFPIGLYEFDIHLNLNENFLDSIQIIDFIIDNIVIIGDISDPEGDNSPNGFEGNQQHDSTEVYYDLGIDFCPDLYESGDNLLCLCDYIDDPQSCNIIDNFVYNLTGTEGNGAVDLNEIFPDEQDVGSDGCPDERETGYEQDQGLLCFDEDNPEYELGMDLNQDNYLLDPSEDNWQDCGSDRLCDEDEVGFDPINNTDPANDNWGSDNLQGTEGNSIWDENEGTEGNGLWDEGEPFGDYGINGLPQELELNCFDCIPDDETEGNELYDEGEPFDDTGIDGLYSVDEDFYNPNGTEGNGKLDENEIFPAEYDCGVDMLCNSDEDGYDENLNSDPSSDDFNIDPNDDNWNDCGKDGNCEFIDEDGTQANGSWDDGEKLDSNMQYDLGEYFYDWGIDQRPDSLEVVLNTYSLSYSAPQTISYEPGTSLSLDNAVDDTRDIIFDLKEINSTSNNTVQIRLNIHANVEFRAMQFRLNHSPIIYDEATEVHIDEMLTLINGSEILEDISIYDRKFSPDAFNDKNSFAVDYMNGLEFVLNFIDLNEFVENNPGIYINKTQTILSLNIDHSDPNYNFFEGSANLWVQVNGQSRFLTSFSASSNKEIIVPFGSVIEDLIKGDVDYSNDMIFYLDGVYNNNSRVVFYKEDYAPMLKVFYSK